RIEDHGREIEIPNAYDDLEGVGYLSGKGLGELLNMEQRATELALHKHGRMALTLSLPQLNAFTLGQLFFLFEAATVFAGALHRVNSWDQPAAEEGRGVGGRSLGRAARDGRTALRRWRNGWRARRAGISGERGARRRRLRWAARARAGAGDRRSDRRRRGRR